MWRHSYFLDLRVLKPLFNETEVVEQKRNLFRTPGADVVHDRISNIFLSWLQSASTVSSTIPTRDRHFDVPPAVTEPFPYVPHTKCQLYV